MPTIVEIGGSGSGGTGSTVDQGNPAAPNLAWPIEITDGSGNVVGNPSNPLPVDIAPPSTAVVTPVPQSITTVTILSSNVARKGAAIFNNISRGFLFLKLGTGCTTLDFSVQVAPGHLYELPFPAYTGIITGVWSVAGGGTAQATEMM